MLANEGSYFMQEPMALKEWYDFFLLSILYIHVTIKAPNLQETFSQSSIIFQQLEFRM